MIAEEIAKAFHESYERLAPDFNYETRKESAKPWSEVPQDNKELMIAVVIDLLSQGIIKSGQVTVLSHEVLVRSQRNTNSDSCSE